MDPKHKSGDAGKSDRPKRSFKVLPLREKVKLLYLIRKGEKEICAIIVLLSHLRPKKLTATVSDKWVVKTEKTLNLYNILRTKAPPYSHKLYYSALF